MALISSQPFIGILITSKNKDKCAGEAVRNNTTNHTSSATNGSKVIDTSILFPVMILVNIIACIFDGCTIGFIDSGVQQSIEISANQNKPKFGVQRLFAAVGNGLAVLLASICVEYFPKYDLPCYSTALFVYGVCMLGLAVSTSYLYGGIDSNSVPDRFRNGEEDEDLLNNFVKEAKQVGTRQSIRKKLCSTLLKFDVLVFLITALVTGIVNGIYLSYLFVLLKQLNCPNIIMGLSILIASFCCVWVFFILEKIIEVLGGTMQCLFVSCFSWSIRLLLTSYIQNPYLILPLQVG